MVGPDDQLSSACVLKKEMAKKGWAIFFIVVSNPVTSSGDLFTLALWKSSLSNSINLVKIFLLLGGIKKATWELFEITH
eukprot:277473-Ditylum_brightwellii.AAC.1